MSNYNNNFNLNMMLFEKLDLENPFKCYSKSLLEQSAKESDWIISGTMYANALELLEFQLRHKTIEKKAYRRRTKKTK